jgi:hypothetical protein
MQASQFKHNHFCWICGNTVNLETCGTDEHGMAVHEQCYWVKVALAKESKRLSVRKPVDRVTEMRHVLSGLGHPLRCKMMPKRSERAIRCPHCRAGNEFLPMVEHRQGWFRCESCGHNAMTLDPEFRCACSKCNAWEGQKFA